jgi:4-hydroxybenzoate polyprenyltransferase
VLVAFVTAFLFFLQLRIADEFKDFEEDSKFRPYRPVPRGLVTLHQLRFVFMATAVVQLVLALVFWPPLSILLFAVWAYLALMTKEFFVRDWLKARPLTYLWTHMLVIPLADFYATACDWMPAGAPPPRGLLWFLIISFFNGVVLELGRKIRAPEQEETGVETYTFLWGRPTAALGWLGALIVAAFCAWQAARQIDFGRPVLVITGVVLAAATTVAVGFLRRPVARRAKAFEMMSGVWTICMYLSLGVLPLLAEAAGLAQ